MRKLYGSAPPPIQQTVHGYSDGHCLLASSVRLPKDADRLVLLLSDLSGSTGGEQFDPYLTGYPVASAGYYALARTWPAPEMPRPGCVWTHTLLIRDELLGGLIRPELLLPLFRRPSRSPSYSEYREAIPVPDGFQNASARGCEGAEVGQSLAEGLLRALYGSADPRTVLAVPRYSFADAPLLAIWRLQWQSLRQRFTFCGGSRGPQTLEGEPFILQGALERDLRRLERGLNPPNLVLWTTGTESTAEEWVRDAAEACADPASNTLQEFIDRIGRGLPGDTTIFRPVVKAHAILRHTGDQNVVARLIELAAEEYPEAGKGREFKRALLSAANLAGLAELALLRGLALSKQHKAIDAEDLDIQARSAALWKEFEQAWSLLAGLLTTGHSPLSEKVINGLVTAMPLNLLGKVLEASPEIIAGVIEHNPQLASSPKLWASKPEHQTRAAAALVTCRYAVASRANEIIRSALNEAADPTSPSLLDVFGPSSVLTVLDWVDANDLNVNRLPPGWRVALAKRQVQVVEWLNSRSSVRPETVAFVLSMIGGDSLTANAAGIAAFAKHVPQEGAALQAVLTPLAGRLLRVSLASELPGAIDLAAACLDPVYHAAAESRVPDDVWQDLTPLLPDGYWWTWDRCYRLRAGIAEKFRSEQWAAARLNDVTRDDAIFREIVAELKERRSGRRVLADAARTVGSSSRRELMLSE
jgi:hypothetical protein